MSHASDLVLGTKLETTFKDRYTVHSHHEYDSDNDGVMRPSIRFEYWEQKELLGQGGFGEVWLQKCVKGKQLHKERAVKIVHTSTGRQASLQRELETIAKFSLIRYSDCFVDYLGWYNTDHMMFITMEYLPLGDLQKHMDSCPPMSEDDTRLVTYQVLGGLQFMHDDGFAHRDIKPGNILIKAKPPSGSWRVKLSDFGISKRLNPTDSMSTIKGTPEYMAPELLECEAGSQIDDRAADMWSLGEMIFRMLTKTSVFPTFRARFAYLDQTKKFPSSQVLEHGASDEALSFILSLMKPTPETRLRPGPALDHDWLQPCKPTMPSMTLPDASILRPNVSDSKTATHFLQNYSRDPWATESTNALTQWQTPEASLIGEEVQYSILADATMNTPGSVHSEALLDTNTNDGKGLPSSVDAKYSFPRTNGPLVGTGSIVSADTPTQQKLPGNSFAEKTASHPVKGFTRDAKINGDSTLRQAPADVNPGIMTKDYFLGTEVRFSRQDAPLIHPEFRISHPPFLGFENDSSPHHYPASLASGIGNGNLYPPDTEKPPLTPTTSDYQIDHDRASEQPLRQPHFPPFLENLKTKPTSEDEGSKNLAVGTRRVAADNLVPAGIENLKPARSSWNPPKEPWIGDSAEVSTQQQAPGNPLAQQTDPVGSTIDTPRRTSLQLNPALDSWHKSRLKGSPDAMALPPIYRSKAHLMNFWFELKDFDGPVDSVAFSSSGLLAGADDTSINIWDLKTTRQCLQRLKPTGRGQGKYGHTSVAFSTDGLILASGTIYPGAQLWDLMTGECRPFGGDQFSILTADFSADGHTLALGTFYNTVELWDTVTGRYQQKLEGHTDFIHTVAFSADGNLLASGSYDKTIRLWEPRTREFLRTLNGHKGYIMSVAFSANSCILASGSRDQTVKLWDTNTGQCRLTLAGHSDGVTSVAFSPNGLLASGSSDETVKIWDPITGECLETIQQSNRVTSVAFSNDNILAAGQGQISEGNGSISLWKAPGKI